MIQGKGNMGKKIITLILVLVFVSYVPVFGLCAYARAIMGEMETETETDLTEEEAEIKEIKESTLYAQSAVLMDARSGRVLYGKNEDDVLPMASTTKIMTLLVALENGKMDEVVTVSSYAASMPDVQLNIREGEQYYLKDLLYSLMLESHNDSAVAIAECVGGSVEGFAQLMNKKAKEIGCGNTTFITPNGLDATATMTDKDGVEKEVVHSTTAQDLAKIMSYCITESEHKETFLEITQTPSYTFSDLAGNRTFSCRNHNSFLYMMEGALSGKTGFTGKAGYCYVGALERDNKTLVVALLACGWPNNKTYKWKDTKKLMEYGLENYEYVTYEDAAKNIPKKGRLQVLEGQTDQIGTTAYGEWERPGTEDGLLLRKDEKMEVEWRLSENKQAPVKKGESAGYVRYRVGNDVYQEEEIKFSYSVDRIDYEWCLDKTIKHFLLF